MSPPPRIGRTVTLTLPLGYEAYHVRFEVLASGINSEPSGVLFIGNQCVAPHIELNRRLK